MPLPPALRFLALAACSAFAAAACARTDASARDASQHSATSSTGTASTSSASGTVAANGSAANGAPHDTISDRADRGRILGDSTAPVWLVMASDFQCPYCKEWHDSQFAGIVRDYAKTGKARIAFVNMPLSMHPFAKPAAEAAMCASVQNKFWVMHDSLFSTQRIWESLQSPLSTFDTLARESGVNMPAWRQCMSRHLTLPLVNADHDRLAAAGVNSTPSFFVDNKEILNPDGSSPGVAADVRGALDAAIARHKTKPSK
jgi:protein-disulfide isomerase